MTRLQYLPNVVTLTLDEQKCTGCRMCVAACPHAVFAMEDDKARIIDRDACMECGGCARNCPSAALTVESGVGCAIAVIRGALWGAKSGGECCVDSRCCG